MREKWCIALDVGATHISGGLVSTRGAISGKREIMTHEKGGTPLRVRILELAAALLADAAESGIKPVGVAAGVPGIVDTERGDLVVAGNLPELLGLPLGPELEDELGLPAHLENDVNAQAVGEMVFGVARDVKNFVLFSIGTDLGGGIIIEGKLHRGAHNIAAEFGHLTLELEGAPCVCGGVGCAREWVSGAGLAEKARKTAADDSLCLAEAKGHRDRVDARHLFRAAHKGEAASVRLVDEFAKRFGAVIANVMKVLDPELVVLAGNICLTEPGLIASIVHWTRHFYFPIPQLPDFRVSELTKETSVLGPAAALFISRGIVAGRESSRKS